MKGIDLPYGCEGYIRNRTQTSEINYDRSFPAWSQTLDFSHKWMQYDRKIEMIERGMVGVCQETSSDLALTEKYLPVITAVSRGR